MTVDKISFVLAGTRNPSKVPAALKLPGIQFVKAGFGDDKETLKVY